MNIKKSLLFFLFLIVFTISFSINTDAQRNNTALVTDIFFIPNATTASPVYVTISSQNFSSNVNNVDFHFDGIFQATKSPGVQRTGFWRYLLGNTVIGEVSRLLSGTSIANVELFAQNSTMFGNQTLTIQHRRTGGGGANLFTESFELIAFANEDSNNTILTHIDINQTSSVSGSTFQNLLSETMDVTQDNSTLFLTFAIDFNSSADNVPELFAGLESANGTIRKRTAGGTGVGSGSYSWLFTNVTNGTQTINVYGRNSDTSSTTFNLRGILLELMTNNTIINVGFTNVSERSFGTTFSEIGQVNVSIVAGNSILSKMCGTWSSTVASNIHVYLNVSDTSGVQQANTSFIYQRSVSPTDFGCLSIIHIFPNLSTGDYAVTTHASIDTGTGFVHNMTSWAIDSLTSEGLVQDSPPGTPSIANINGIENFNGLEFNGNISIGVNVESDPDGGIVTSNLTLTDLAGNFIFLINGSFNNTNPETIAINFDTSLVNGSIYRLRVSSFDDESNFVSSLSAENFTILSREQLRHLYVVLILISLVMYTIGKYFEKKEHHIYVIFQMLAGILLISTAITVFLIGLPNINNELLNIAIEFILLGLGFYLMINSAIFWFKEALDK